MKTQEFYIKQEGSQLYARKDKPFDERFNPIETQIRVIDFAAYDTVLKDNERLRQERNDLQKWKEEQITKALYPDNA